MSTRPSMDDLFPHLRTTQSKSQAMLDSHKKMGDALTHTLKAIDELINDEEKQKSAATNIRNNCP